MITKEEWVRVVPGVQGQAGYCRHFVTAVSECRKGLTPVNMMVRGRSVTYRYADERQNFDTSESIPCHRHLNFHGASCPHADFKTVKECDTTNRTTGSSTTSV